MDEPRRSGESLPDSLRPIAHTDNSPSLLFAAATTGCAASSSIRGGSHRAGRRCCALRLKICKEPATGRSPISSRPRPPRFARGWRPGSRADGAVGRSGLRVAAALIHRAIGDRLKCVFVDNGLLRRRARADGANVRAPARNRSTVTDASNLFLGAWQGCSIEQAKDHGRTHRCVRVGRGRSARGSWGRAPVSRCHRIGVVQGPSAVTNHHNVGACLNE